MTLRARAGSSQTGMCGRFWCPLHPTDECQTVRTMDFAYQLLVLLVLMSSAVLALATLTALGALRRGQGMLGAMCSGLFFPVTWAVWYAKDELSNRDAHTSPR